MKCQQNLVVDQYIQVYLDVQSLVKIGNIDESDLTRNQVRFLRQTLGSLAVVSTSDESHERIQLSPTLSHMVNELPPVTQDCLRRPKGQLTRF